MALCQCEHGPKCEHQHCGNRADLSAMVLASWKPPLRYAPKFFCDACWKYFRATWHRPMKGIDRPEGADEWWRPSIMDHLRYGQIEIAFNERARRVANPGLWRHGDDKYTPAQLENMMNWRRGLQRLREGRR